MIVEFILGLYFVIMMLLLLCAFRKVMRVLTRTRREFTLIKGDEYE